MVDKGYALGKGNRSFEAVSKVATIQSKEPEVGTEHYPTARVAYARGKTHPVRPKQRFGPNRGEGCYICGGDHPWRYCKEKSCPACGQKGHLLKDCSDRKSSGSKYKVMQAGQRNGNSEMSAVLPVTLNGEPITALLDSGAGPSVLDIRTVCDLGLDSKMTRKTGKVFGLSQDPVEVIGRVTLTLDLGDEQVIQHSFEILDGAQDTCILGRDLLAKFDTTEFN